MEVYFKGMARRVEGEVASSATQLLYTPLFSDLGRLRPATMYHPEQISEI
jgi:hypothetical protein